MKTLLAATLVVRVLGLATITNKVPNDCGTHVIVPRVSFHSHMPQQQTSPQVEDHTAMLIVPAAFYDATLSTWKMAPIPALPKYMYVALDGDQIRVLTNGVNAPPDLTNLTLPRLRGCCPASAIKGLSSRFQAPYTGAAAVLDVPFGLVNGCGATVSGGNVRYDTEILLNHRGSVKISGDTMKERKQIVLKDLPPKGFTGVVYLANLPTCFLTNSCTAKVDSAPDGLAHVHAYYQMLDGVTSRCTSTMKDCSPPPAVRRCKSPMISTTGGAQAFTFECSNTQWP